MHLPQLRSSAPMSLPLTAINAPRQLEILRTCRLQMPSVLSFEPRGVPTTALADTGISSLPWGFKEAIALALER
jgi:hypothetical protein